MHVRLAFWHSLTKGGWVLPITDRLTPRELDEERRMRKLILESRKYARPEDFELPSRTIRLLIGRK